MLEKTRGLIISSIKYKENSLIVRIYTEYFGLQSFIVNGVHSKKSKFPPSFFQPLSLLDLIIYYKENNALKRLSEAKYSHPFKSITFDYRKSSIALFITEILQKTIKEEVSDEALFQFLFRQVLLLEELPYSPDFHLYFLVKLTQFLGFQPQNASEITSNTREKIVVEKLLIAEHQEMYILKSNTERRSALTALVNFYAANTENFGTLKSLKVLNELFNPL